MFAERFFEGFALAFSTAHNVSFTIRLLTGWLATASKPLLEHGAAMPQGKAAQAEPSAAPAPSTPRSRRGGARSRAELQRTCKPNVASLLRMLTAFVVQVTPSPPPHPRPRARGHLPSRTTPRPSYTATTCPSKHTIRRPVTLPSPPTSTSTSCAQYAPSEVEPAHFAALAPHVLAHFTQSVDGDVSPAGLEPDALPITC
jgi:hypothetical protein